MSDKDAASEQLEIASQRLCIVIESILINRMPQPERDRVLAEVQAIVDRVARTVADAERIVAGALP